MRMRDRSRRPGRSRPAVEALEPRALLAAFGTNLIVNGGAEDGPSAPDGRVVVPIPGWEVTNGLNVVAYGFGDFPDADDPGPPTRGAKFFTGGFSQLGSIARATQRVDVADLAAEIDAAAVAFELSGWLGGWYTHDDRATLTATFLGADGSPLPSAPGASTLAAATIGPVTKLERGARTALLERSTTGLVPAGTRAIRLDLVMERFDPQHNDGYADELSLVLRRPEPAGTLQFSAAQFEVREGQPEAVVTVTRTGGRGGRAVARIAVSGGSATAGADYTAPAAEVVFEDGDDAPREVRIPIVDDALVEGTEAVELALQATAGGATLGQPQAATLLIHDNDAPSQPTPPIRFLKRPFKVRENGNRARITLVLRRPAPADMVVEFVTVQLASPPRRGFATEGLDYVATRVQVVIPHGQKRRDVFVPLRDDNLTEGNERVGLELREVGTGRVIQRGQLVIVDARRPRRNPKPFPRPKPKPKPNPKPSNPTIRPPGNNNGGYVIAGTPTARPPGR